MLKNSRLDLLALVHQTVELRVVLMFSDLQVMAQLSQADLQTNYQASDQHADLNPLSETELWQALDYARTFSFEVTLPKSDGVLTGLVINATTNEPVADVEVTLHGFQNNSEIANLIARTDSAGNL